MRIAASASLQDIAAIGAAISARNTLRRFMSVIVAISYQLSAFSSQSL
jgi:hypothetical protein